MFVWLAVILAFSSFLVFLTSQIHRIFWVERDTQGLSPTLKCITCCCSFSLNCEPHRERVFCFAFFTVISIAYRTKSLWCHLGSLSKLTRGILYLMNNGWHLNSKHMDLVIHGYLWFWQKPYHKQLIFCSYMCIETLSVQESFESSVDKWVGTAWTTPCTFSMSADVLICSIPSPYPSVFFSWGLYFIPLFKTTLF